MHLGNSIICPVTGIPMIATMGAAAFYAFKKAKADFTRDKILTATVLTALIFALQMINFTIPTTASSGHIIGAVLLSIILGPYVAFLAVASILIIQSLFFADGGILALGLNIFNMGFLACFVAYPFVYKMFKNKTLGAFAASIAAIEIGAAAIAIEGSLSGSILNIAMFTSLMTSIHLVIGVFEGVFTAGAAYLASKTKLSKKFTFGAGAIALVLAGVVSNYASNKPDGLEWSLINMPKSLVRETEGVILTISESIQTKTAIFENLSLTLGGILGILAVSAVTFGIFTTLSKKNVKA